MRSRLLIVGALVAVCVAVGALLFGSAVQQAGAQRAAQVELLLAGGAE